MAFLIDHPKLIIAGIMAIGVIMYWYYDWKDRPSGDEQGARHTLKKRKEGDPK